MFLLITVDFLSPNAADLSITNSAMMTDGKWKMNMSPFFSDMCTICSFERYPQLILKGFCLNAFVSWIFMPVNSINNSVIYDGYKNSLMEFIDNKWIIQERVPMSRDFSIISLQTDTRSSYPIGRKTWYAQHFDTCPENNGNLLLALSACKFGAEFTCNNGNCTSIMKRCDGIYDCEDESDEEKCVDVFLDPLYNYLHPAKNLDSQILNRSESVNAQIMINSIYKIDTISMQVGFDLYIFFDWKDPGITYVNSIDNEEDMNGAILFPNDVKVWVPAEYVIFENEVIGETLIDQEVRTLKAYIDNDPIIFHPDNPYEDLTFAGKKANLSCTDRAKVIFKCSFDLLSYPFDHQVCNFTLRIPDVDGIRTSFDKVNISTAGRSVFTEYLILNPEISSHEDKKGSLIVFSLRFQRWYVQTLLTTYYQSALLLLLSYMTFYINIDDFNSRFMGALTILLALATSLYSVRERLPDTSYMKMMDVWCIWLILNNIIIIVVLILIDRYQNIPKVNKVVPINAQGPVKYAWSDREVIPEKLNFAGKVVFPLINIMFVVLYFLYSAEIFDFSFI